MLSQFSIMLNQGDDADINRRVRGFLMLLFLALYLPTHVVMSLLPHFPSELFRFIATAYTKEASEGEVVSALQLVTGPFVWMTLFWLLCTLFDVFVLRKQLTLKTEYVRRRVLIEKSRAVGWFLLFYFFLVLFLFISVPFDG